MSPQQEEDNITPVFVKRNVVIPDFEILDEENKDEDVPTEDVVEEFVDKEGRTVRRIVKRTVTTKTISIKQKDKTTRGSYSRIENPVSTCTS